MLKAGACARLITVIRETPDISEVDGESDDGEQKVDFFVPRLSRLLLVSRRRCRALVERGDFVRGVSALAPAAPVPASNSITFRVFQSLQVFRVTRFRRGNEKGRWVLTRGSRRIASWCSAFCLLLLLLLHANWRTRHRRALIKLADFRRRITVRMADRSRTRRGWTRCRRSLGDQSFFSTQGGIQRTRQQPTRRRDRRHCVLTRTMPSLD